MNRTIFLIILILTLVVFNSQSLIPPEQRSENTELSGNDMGEPSNTCGTANKEDTRSYPLGLSLDLEYPRWYRDVDGDGFGDNGDHGDIFPGPGLVGNNLDCNDDNEDINPLAEEDPDDGIDNDCDGEIDENPNAWYEDYDNDGFGDIDDDDPIYDSRDPGFGYSPNNLDCDDGDDQIYPTSTADDSDSNNIDNNCNGFIDDFQGRYWFYDADGDGYGNASIALFLANQPSPRYVANDLDCDDSDDTIYPGATEIADGKDNDCDGQVDEGFEMNWYEDADGDGYGNPDSYLSQVLQPVGYVVDSSDCDDSDENVHPGAPEIDDGVDNDCDGDVDEGWESNWWPDVDGDGYGDSTASSIYTANPPDGYVEDNTDCDDSNGAIYPGADEIADGIDNDCDGDIDEGLEMYWYEDADGDGYGNADSYRIQALQPDGYVADNSDCNDNDVNVNPGATEIVDGIDNNCDGQVDEGFEMNWYEDADGDGYGNPDSYLSQALQPDGYVADNSDCNDSDVNVNPGATEIADGIDNDCDGEIDEISSVDTTSTINNTQNEEPTAGEDNLTDEISLSSSSSFIILVLSLSITPLIRKKRNRNV